MEKLIIPEGLLESEATPEGLKVIEVVGIVSGPATGVSNPLEITGNPSY